MKTLKSTIKYALNLLLLVFSIFAFFSCDNITEKNEAESGLARIMVNIANREKFETARTIFAPDKNLSTLDYKLYGAHEGGQETLLASDKTALVETGTWNFRLELLENSSLCYISSLTGVTVVQGNNTLNFVLEDAAGIGSLRITVNLPNGTYGAENASVRPLYINTVKAGLFTSDGQEMASFPLEIVSANIPAESVSCEVVKTNVPSGTYILAAEFYTDSGCTDRCAYWSELVHVKANSQTEATVTPDFERHHKVVLSYEGGQYIGSRTLQTYYNEQENIDLADLPSADEVYRFGYTLSGWKDSSTNDLISSLPVAKDYNLSAVWQMVPITGITIAADVNYVASGETLELRATVSPETALQDIVWSTSDSSLATVSENGIVTGVASSGTVTITATGADGFAQSIDLSLEAAASGVLKKQDFRNYLKNHKNELVFAPGCTDDDELYKYLKSFDVANTYTSISGAFEGCISLESVAIPDSITSIGSSSFDGCSALTSVTIPGNVTSIGSYAFRNCTSLESITIPAAGTSIGSYAFTGCTGLTSVTLPLGVRIGIGVFQGCTSLSSVTIQNGFKTISESMFQGCTSLKSVELSSSATSISKNAFEGSGIESITIGAGVTSIGESAFANCASLSSVTYSSSVAPSVSMFENCTSLEQISLPNVTSIGRNAFKNCSSLSAITIKASLAEDYSAFGGCVNLHRVNATGTVSDWLGSKKVSVLSNYADLYLNDAKLEEVEINERFPCGTFENCTSLKKVIVSSKQATFDANILKNTPIKTFEIGIDEFPSYITNSKCAELETLIVRDNITSISSSMRSGFRYFKKIVIGSGVTSFPDGMISSCSKLEEIVIPFASNFAAVGKLPASLRKVTVSSTNISEGAFENCSTISEIVVPDDLTSIPERAFKGCSSLGLIRIPSSVTAIGDYAFEGCSSLRSIYYGGTLDGWLSLNLTAENNPLVNISDLYIQESKLENLTLPSSMLTVPEFGFAGCSSIKTVDFANATAISDGAFKNCTGISVVSIPSAVTSVGSGAFGGCSSLKEITVPFVGRTGTSLDTGEETYFEYIFGTDGIPSSLGKVTVLMGDIPASAFYGCQIKEVVLPPNVSSIGKWAFKYSGIETISLPASLSSVGEDAFTFTESLKSVYFAGTLNDYLNFDGLVFIGSGGRTGYDLYINGQKIVDLEFTSETIREWAFAYCGSIKTVTFNASSGSIKDRAFYSCKNIESVSWETSYGSIGTYAFEGCSNLSSIQFPQGIKNIPIGLFKDCPNLPDDLVIPEGVEVIGRYAFQNSERTKKAGALTLPSTLKEIQGYAFLGYKFIDVYIYAEEPPTISLGINNAFGRPGAYEKLYIYVPSASWTKYNYEYCIDYEGGLVYLGHIN